MTFTACGCFRVDFPPKHLTYCCQYYFTAALPGHLMSQNHIWPVYRVDWKLNTCPQGLCVLCVSQARQHGKSSSTEEFGETIGLCVGVACDWVSSCESVAPDRTKVPRPWFHIRKRRVKNCPVRTGCAGWPPEEIEHWGYQRGSWGRGN